MLNIFRCLMALCLLIPLMACDSDNQQKGASQGNEQSSSQADKISGTHDYMVAVNRPNKLHVIDLSLEKVIRSCDLPGKVLPGTVVMAPDRMTAFVLGGSWDRIYGVDIKNCQVTFDTQFSKGNIRSKSIASIAVSRNGEEVYTIHNRTRLLNDRYEVLEPQFVVYKIEDGVGAKPNRQYPAPRQVNIMASGMNGLVYLSSDDIYAIDPKTGEVNVALPSRSQLREGYGQPDILTVWPLGEVNKEFVRQFTVPKFKDESRDLATAEWLWGYEKVDLITGETEIKDYAPLSVVYFTGMIRPGHPDEFYGLLTQLTRHKISETKVIKSIDLERTYYCINFSTDGSKIYLGGTYNDIAIYDAETLTKIGQIDLVGGDMSLGTQQVFSLSPEKLSNSADS